MGIISAPAGAIVCIDANAVIYSIESIGPYWPALEPLWRTVAAGEITVIGSELLVLETLVGPSKAGDQVLYQAYEQALVGGDIHLKAVSIDVLRSAANLRARHKLSAPDAIHAATSIQHGATIFLTNDGGFGAFQG